MMTLNEMLDALTALKIEGFGHLPVLMTNHDGSMNEVVRLSKGGGGDNHHVHATCGLYDDGSVSLDDVIIASRRSDVRTRAELSSFMSKTRPKPLAGLAIMRAEINGDIREINGVLMDRKEIAAWRAERGDD